MSFFLRIIKSHVILLNNQPHIEVLICRTPRNATLRDEMKSKYIEHIQNYYVKLYKLELPRQSYTSAIFFSKARIDEQFVVSCVVNLEISYTSVITYSGGLLALRTTDSTCLITISIFKTVPVD